MSCARSRWSSLSAVRYRPTLLAICGAYQRVVGAATLAAERREHPGDDFFSSLVNADVDGDRLADSDVAAFFVLLSVAANDTTRQTTSHAMQALADLPAQRAWLREDFDNRIGGAVEEFIRWASPVMSFRRTATTNYELGGQTIRAGEKVAMGSALLPGRVYEAEDTVKGRVVTLKLMPDALSQNPTYRKRMLR